jgi:putative oxidoreductase
LTEAKFRESKLHDITHFGIRAAIGVIFIVQGSGKFDPGVAGFLVQFVLVAVWLRPRTS